jgi:hypothetical protein
MNISDEIKRLHELHQAGALSDSEFEQAKAKLLNASLNFNQTNDSGFTGSKSSTNSNSSNNSNNIANDISQLRRSKGDRWLGGVCGGPGQGNRHGLVDLAPGIRAVYGLPRFRPGDLPAAVDFRPGRINKD